jgi:hypothetical protein
MHGMACRAYGGRGGLLNREGAWKVLWPCDPIIGHRRMMALHWRPLRDAGSTLDWLPWTTPPRQQSCRASRRYFFPTWVSSCELLGSTSVGSVVSKPSAWLIWEGATYLTKDLDWSS